MLYKKTLLYCLVLFFLSTPTDHPLRSGVLLFYATALLWWTSGWTGLLQVDPQPVSFLHAALISFMSLSFFMACAFNASLIAQAHTPLLITATLTVYLGGIWTAQNGGGFWFWSWDPMELCSLLLAMVPLVAAHLFGIWQTPLLIFLVTGAVSLFRFSPSMTSHHLTENTNDYCAQWDLATFLQGEGCGGFFYFILVFFIFSLLNKRCFWGFPFSEAKTSPLSWLLPIFFLIVIPSLALCVFLTAVFFALAWAIQESPIRAERGLLALHLVGFLAASAPLCSSFFMFSLLGAWEHVDSSFFFASGLVYLLLSQGVFFFRGTYGSTSLATTSGMVPLMPFICSNSSPWVVSN